MIDRRGFLKLLGVGSAGVVGVAILPARAPKSRKVSHQGSVPAYTFMGDADSGIYRSDGFAFGVTGWKLSASD